MASFVALYRGKSVAAAELVAVSTDPSLIAHVADVLLRKPPRGGTEQDPALMALNHGRRRALELVRDEVEP